MISRLYMTAQGTAHLCSACLPSPIQRTPTMVPTLVFTTWLNVLAMEFLIYHP